MDRTFELQGEELAKLRLASDRGMPLVGPDEDDPIRGVDDVDAMIVDMLHGIDAGHAKRLLTWAGPATYGSRIPETNRAIGMSLLTARMFAAHGVDPLVLHVFGTVIGEIEVHVDHGRHAYRAGIQIKAAQRAIVALSPHVSWDSRGRLIFDTLPQTVVNSAKGMKLARILTHPVLDGLDLTIRSIKSTANGVATINTDARHEEARLDDLLSLHPRGGRPDPGTA